MKIILLVMTFLSIATVQADTKLLIQFDGDHHQIIKVKNIKPRGLISNVSSEMFTNEPRKAVIQFQTANGESSVALNDPRVIRAPLSQQGYGHEHILIREQGFYTVTLPQDSVYLNTLAISLPGNNKVLQLKLKQ